MYFISSQILLIFYIIDPLPNASNKTTNFE